MITIDQVISGVIAWNSKMAEKKPFTVFGTGIQFEIPVTSPIPLDTTSSDVNVYFALVNNNVYAICIQGSKDLKNRYLTSAGRNSVYLDMVIVQSTIGGSVSVAGSTIDSNVFSAITYSEANARITAFGVSTNRTQAYNTNGNSGPVFFQIPAVNFQLSGNKSLYFGLRILGENGTTTYNYNLIIGNQPLGGVLNFYNMGRPCPPYGKDPAKSMLFDCGLAQHTNIIP